MLSPIGVAVCVIFIFLLIFLYFHRNREIYKLASQFHGPLSLPIIGCLYLFLGNSESIYRRILKFYETFPSPFRVWLGPRLVITVFTPDEAKAILQSRKTIEKDESYRLFKPWLGEGLFTARADIWRVHRKLIQPTFNQRILNSFVEIFQKNSVILNEEFEKIVNGEEFTILNYLSNTLLSIILESSMGLKLDNKGSSRRKFMEAVEQIIKTVSTRGFKIWLQSDFIFKLTRLSKEFAENIKYVHSITENIIETKRKTITTVKEAETSDEFIKMRKPFLDLLMTLSQEGKTFTNIELRDEVTTLLVAGYDTTALSLSFVILMLASHPQIQDKAYQEIYDIYGTTDPDEVPVTCKDLPKLVYLDRVIKETMRLFPVSAIIVRTSEENFELGKYIIPKGSAIVIGISRIHRDEKFWPEPLKFDPDRFLPEQIAKRHQYSYLPFSGGLRNCIGEMYAMMMMKTIISVILRKYILKKDNIQRMEDIRLKFDIFLQPVEPIKIRLENRIVK
ncbi:cytochrome P450 4g15-like isoform X1 [Leptopilina boulardi]|uniref:cytochrome P450 4g15-like isoform X1 n=1 Tax=Leptopilina boulardi TaxID=63433 RepID=UPI0021F60801|nr:cytochrome P450 4g15-like isoform X1 [Leptopilina boulardi]